MFEYGLFYESSMRPSHIIHRFTIHIILIPQPPPPHL